VFGCCPGFFCWLCVSLFEVGLGFFCPLCKCADVFFEFEKLTIHPDSKERYLTSKELEKMYEFNDRNNNCYFTGIRDGIRFQNYVGVIQIGGLTIEILPKADKSAIYKDDYKYWHAALLNMLKVCKHIDVTSVSEASLKRKHNSLLDLYFELFLTSLLNDTSRVCF
jgi:5-methylcytosine-specific restriction enzyme subunit McrC